MTNAPAGGPAGATAPGEARPATARLHDLLHEFSTLGPAVVLVLSIFAFSIFADGFLEPTNLSLIIQQTAVVGTLAVGQTLIILTAGIHPSVGAVMVLTSVVMARRAAGSGVPGGLALVMGLALGTACGLLNGGLVTRLKLPPFIVTLGTLNIFFALNLYISQSETIRGTDMSSVLLWTGNTFTLFDAKITYGSVIMLALVAVVSFALLRTAWGRHVYATGDDLDAARLSGVRTDRVLLSVYMLAGLICAVAAWVLIGRIASASPQAGTSANLDTITAGGIGGGGPLCRPRRGAGAPGRAPVAGGGSPRLWPSPGAGPP